VILTYMWSIAHTELSILVHILLVMVDHCVWGWYVRCLKRGICLVVRVLMTWCFDVVI